MNLPKKLTIVIDSNVLLVTLSSRSQYHWLYELILEGKVIPALSQEIISEYEEIISKHWNDEVAKNTIRSLLELPDAKFTNTYFNLLLISADQDDNKFVDCAFAANADYIITHDAHFNILKEVEFPKIPVVDIHAFRKIIESEKLL